MSSVALPSLVLFPERADPGDSWQVQLEAVVTGLPMSLRPRLGQPLIKRFIRHVNRLEPALCTLEDEALRAQAEELRLQLHSSGLRDHLLASAFALIRETARRQLGLRHYDVQLRAGYAMLKGMVAELDTGEGKTLAATLAVATAALGGIPVHVVTVNDYLAKRDAGMMEPLYRALGLSVGLIVHGLPPAERRAR